MKEGKVDSDEEESDEKVSKVEGDYLGFEDYDENEDKKTSKVAKGGGGRGRGGR